MRTLILSLALLSTSAQAYYGWFTPHLVRNQVTLRVIKTHVPNLECVARMNPLLAPIGAVTVVGCFYTDDNTLIIPADYSPICVWMLGNALITCDAMRGHEFRHAFEPDFHPPYLSFLPSSWLSDPPDSQRGDVRSE